NGKDHTDGEPAGESGLGDANANPEQPRAQKSQADGYAMAIACAEGKDRAGPEYPNLPAAVERLLKMKKIGQGRGNRAVVRHAQGLIYQKTIHVLGRDVEAVGDRAIAGG